MFTVTELMYYDSGCKRTKCSRSNSNICPHAELTVVYLCWVHGALCGALGRSQVLSTRSTEVGEILTP